MQLLKGLSPVIVVQDTHDLLRARWCEPTLSIVDVRVGDDEVNSHDPHYRFGPTRFSVIPRLAVGNIRQAGFAHCDVHHGCSLWSGILSTQAEM